MLGSKLKPLDKCYIIISQLISTTFILNTYMRVWLLCTCMYMSCYNFMPTPSFQQTRLFLIVDILEDVGARAVIIIYMYATI